MGAIKATCKVKPDKGQMWMKDRYVTLLPKGVKLGKAIKTTTKMATESSPAAIVTALITEGRAEDAMKKYPLTPEIWSTILKDQPPNSNNKYLMWIGKVVSATEPSSWVNNANRALQTVRAFAQSMPGKDIYQFPSIDAAIEAMDAQEPKPVSKKAKLRNELKVVHEDVDWKVYMPESHEAMMKIGGGTSWCVATSSEGHWKNYFSKGAFLVLKAKHEIVIPGDEDKAQAIATSNAGALTPWARQKRAEQVADGAVTKAGERFALYAQDTYSKLEVYNEDDDEIGRAEMERLTGDNRDLWDFVDGWISDVEESSYEKREQAETVAMDEYANTPGDGPHDFLTQFAEEYMELDVNIPYNGFEAAFNELSPAQQSLLKTATYYSSSCEPDAYGTPKASIEGGKHGRYQEYINHEASEQDLENLESIVYQITGLSPIDTVIPDPEVRKKVRQTNTQADDIVVQAGSRIKDKAAAMRGQPQLWPDVEPSDGAEVNAASLRKQLQRDGYDEIAASMEAKIDIDSEQLIAFLLEGI